MLLAVGDQYEAEIAKNRELDAKIPLSGATCRSKHFVLRALRHSAVCRVRVITAKTRVHAALFLVLAFFTASGHWMLLQPEFLAISLVLVYVGAVMVLFLFVVMMLDIDFEQLRGLLAQSAGGIGARWPPSWWRRC